MITSFNESVFRIIPGRFKFSRRKADIVKKQAEQAYNSHIKTDPNKQNDIYHNNNNTKINKGIFGFLVD